ncbi:MAG: metallophosphoesterase [Pirellula sp.]
MPVLILVIVVVGHFGVWIALYNRINATGFHRITIKRIEKLIVLCCGLIPLAILAFESSRIGLDGVLQSLASAKFPWHWSTIAYSVLTGCVALGLAPLWLRDRPQFASAKTRFRIAESADFHPLKEDPTSRDRILIGSSFRKMSRLPGNQIASLQRNIKELLVPSLPRELQGMTIAHISDVHLTGHISNEYYRLAMDWVCDQKPEMIVVSGDIVDYQRALVQLEPVFEGLCAPMGMYFVLGNHDRRLSDPSMICNQLCRMGWSDLGQREFVARRGVTPVRMIGNELPWFSRGTPILDVSIHAWTIGVSHSPDQWRWGLANRCGLMLCGHTHGGQIRFPVIGPVITPSWFGSRYASGVFLRESTLMHVSRGISGVHPFRWGCIPEVSLLKLF